MPLPNRSTATTFDAVNKINNQTVPPAVQATDWDNTKLAPAISDVAGLGLTAPRFWARVTLHNATSCILLAWQAVWGNVTLTTPIVSSPTNVTYRITLPTLVSDEYDASLGLTNNITVALQSATISVESYTNFCHYTVRASGNIIDIGCFDSSGNPTSGDNNTVFIVAY